MLFFIYLRSVERKISSHRYRLRDIYTNTQKKGDVEFGNMSVGPIGVDPKEIQCVNSNLQTAREGEQGPRGG